MTGVRSAATRRAGAASSRIACAFLAVSVTALTCYRLHSNLATTGLIELLVVLALALKLDFWSASAASLAAYGYLNFFFTPPLFSFSVTDPKNWVALLAFEGSALIVSRPSSAVKHSAEEATLRESELAKLYEVSRVLLLIEGQEKSNTQLLALLQKTFGADVAVLFDGEDSGALDALARQAYFDNRDLPDTTQKTLVRVLRMGVRPIGALALSGTAISVVTANSLAWLAAIGMERAHSTDEKAAFALNMKPNSCVRQCSILWPMPIRLRSP